MHLPIWVEPTELTCFLFCPVCSRASSYLILISIGHLRDFFGKKFYPVYYRDLMPHDVSALPRPVCELVSSQGGGQPSSPSCTARRRRQLCLTRI
jgi:hypothetical protein